MRKAFVCAWVSMRLYIRSGRGVFPLLMLIGYPLLLYHVLPVETVSSFLMSTVEAFAWGAWVAIAANWSEDRTLRQIFLVKAGQGRYFLAKDLWLILIGAAGGAFLILTPALAHVIYLRDMFVVPPSILDVALGLTLNVSAGICGAAFGSVFHPRFIRDRKIAYMLSILIGLMGLAGGVAGIPLAPRLLFPPIYDTIALITGANALTVPLSLGCAMWYLLYAALCVGLQTLILRRTQE